jgi:hypothetical protein
MNQQYTDYLNSPEWREKRKKRLRHDNYRCRTCWNTERLQVHHCTYERLYDEWLDDLITLCEDCHAAVTVIIRARRAVASRAPVVEQQRQAAPSRGRSTSWVTDVLKKSLTRAKKNSKTTHADVAAKLAEL